MWDQVKKRKGARRMPRIENTQALKIVRDIYEMDAQTARETPGGTVGYTFSIDDRFFLKLYDTRLAITGRCTERLLEQLQVLEWMKRQTPMGDSICFPIKTADGALFFQKENIIGVMFNFIPGKALGFGKEYSKEECVQLAQLVRTLHSLDIEPIRSLCPSERFENSFLDTLVGFMDREIFNLPKSFARLVEDNRDMTLRCMEQTLALAGRLKKMNLNYVLCHTDIHGGNIIKAPEGKLFLVDWENMITAPKEADLFFFCERQDFSLFCDEANPEALKYYQMRRDLEDIKEFWASILNDEFSLNEQEVVYGHMRRIFYHLNREIDPSPVFK